MLADRMSRQQESESSVQSLEDCWSETEVRPVTTCWQTCRRSPKPCPADAAPSQSDASDVSLHSCNSNETLKQWTMQYPVTARCDPWCGSFAERRRRRRRKRRRRSCDDDASDEEEDSAGEMDVGVTYTDCNGEVRCCRQNICIPRKPCTLVCLHISDGDDHDRFLMIIKTTTTTTTTKLD